MQQISYAPGNSMWNLVLLRQDPVKLVRRGILMCGATGCDFVMLLPGDAAAEAQIPTN